MNPHTARPLKIGLGLPTLEGTMAGVTPRWHDLKRMAQHAEAVGFDSVWVPDHLIFNPGDPGVPPLGVWECWSLVASLAAVTTRAEIGTLVACASFRNPALLAKTADTIDEISVGRLILGLGAGYHEPEYNAFGYPFDHLAGRFEESLKIIHTLLREGSIDFQGQYYTTRDCELRPRGPTRTGPPILIGARPDKPRALRLTAQYADYWNIFAVNQVEKILPALAAVDSACMKTGRDPATLQRTVTLLVDLPGSESAKAGGLANYRASRTPATGRPEELAELLRDIARSGVSHVQIFLEPSTMTGIDAFAPTLALLDRG
jgi:alkanesulfonate monooxygenase SsuD/methylene tetrahydromethanopterin reductase-like flavin-dependent oxidoreductase (luciferase family)